MILHTCVKYGPRRTPINFGFKRSQVMAKLWKFEYVAAGVFVQFNLELLILLLLVLVIFTSSHSNPHITLILPIFFFGGGGLWPPTILCNSYTCHCFGKRVVGKIFRTCGVAVIIPTDCPKSVRVRCVIEVFGSVFMLSHCFFELFYGWRAFCHRTESDIFLFVPRFSIRLSVCPSVCPRHKKL